MPALLERSIEGRHAVAQRAAVRAPNHLGAYMSSALRMPACVEALEVDPQVLVRLEKHFSSVRLPEFDLRHLGLMQTLSVRALASPGLPHHPRGKRFFQMVRCVLPRRDTLPARN